MSLMLLKILFSILSENTINQISETMQSFMIPFGFLLLVCTINAIDIALMQKLIQNNSNEIVKIIGDHLGWNDNLKVYYHAFLDKKFQKFTGDDPIFVYELTFTQSWGQFGNRLGHYYEILTLCKLAGLHFVGFIRTDFEQPAKIISDALPIYVQHPNPAKDHSDGAARLRKLPYDDWPWTTLTATTWQNLPEIGSLTTKVANIMQKTYHPNMDEHLLESSFDLLINKKSKPLPYIPYAVILTRCSDLIRAGHFDEYGMINFNVYLMTIPTEATEIYILAEPLNYGSEHGAKICQRLISNLADYLHEYYPNTVIGVRRGHVHHGFVQLTKSKYTVCAPSTFCLWPGIANTENNVYYQPSKLVADGKKIYIHSNFNWISYPMMYTYMMSEYDEKHEIETADGLTKMLSKVLPRCSRTKKIELNNVNKTLDKWDCMQ